MASVQEKVSRVSEHIASYRKTEVGQKLVSDENIKILANGFSSESLAKGLVALAGIRAIASVMDLDNKLFAKLPGFAKEVMEGKRLGVIQLLN